MTDAKKSLLPLVILSIISALVCAVIGLVAGITIGGNYFTGFRFAGAVGYEATGYIGLIAGGVFGLVLPWIIGGKEEGESE